MQDKTDNSIHLKLAQELFNQAWELLDREERTPEEDELMVHTSHASRYHWSCVGNAQNFAIGDWQLSRIYAMLDRPEPASWYAGLSIETCVVNDLDPFYTAYGYEALARAFAIGGEVKFARDALAEAGKYLTQVTEPESKQALKADLDDVLRIIALESEDAPGA